MKNNNFLKQNMGTLFMGPVIVLLLCIIGSLYGINIEYLFYLLFAVLVVWIVTLAVQYKIYKKLITQIEEMVPTENEEEKIKWEQTKQKEDFFAMWAHQIKTPIAALNLLFQSENPNLYDCKQETFKIESYVEMALNYLRFDNMSNDLVLNEFSLEEIVKGSVKKCSTIFIHKHLRVSLENLDFRVLSDEKWLSFILEQLISNAVKYTYEGGVTISAAKEGELIKLSIADTGIGIKSEDLPRLGEKGFTGYNGRMDKKASGLGLYLSKGICKKLGHSLEIKSIEGQGTTVIISMKDAQKKKNDLTKM